jgi:hypothetical protein
MTMCSTRMATFMVRVRSRLRRAPASAPASTLLPAAARALGLRKFQAATGLGGAARLNGGNTVRRGVVMVGTARVAAFHALVLWILSLAHDADSRTDYVHKKAHPRRPFRCVDGVISIRAGRPPTPTCPSTMMAKPPPIGRLAGSARAAGYDLGRTMRRLRQASDQSRQNTGTWRVLALGLDGAADLAERVRRVASPHCCASVRQNAQGLKCRHPRLIDVREMRCSPARVLPSKGCWVPRGGWRTWPIRPTKVPIRAALPQRSGVRKAPQGSPRCLGAHCLTSSVLCPLLLALGSRTEPVTEAFNFVDLVLVQVRVPRRIFVHLRCLRPWRRLSRLLLPLSRGAAGHHCAKISSTTTPMSAGG